MEENIAAMIDDLLKLARHTEVVHHIAGRIRLRVLLSGIAISRGIDLEQIRTHFPGILDIRVNTLVGSVVIKYDQRRIAPEIWTTMSKLRKSPELAPELYQRIRSLCV